MSLTCRFPEENTRFSKPYVALGTGTSSSNPITATLTSMDDVSISVTATVLATANNLRWAAVFDIPAKHPILGHRCDLVLIQTGSAKVAVTNLRMPRPARKRVRAAKTPKTAAAATAAAALVTGTIEITSPLEGTTVASHASCIVSGSVTGGQLSSATATYENGVAANVNIMNTGPSWVIELSSGQTGRKKISVTVFDTNSNADNIEFFIDNGVIDT